MKTFLQTSAIAVALLTGAFSVQSCMPLTPSGSCVDSCSKDSDCGLGEYCLSGECQRKHTFCATPAISMNDRGESDSCAGFACDSATGKCITEAWTSDDCQGGWAPNGSGQCIPAGCAGPDGSYTSACSPGVAPAYTMDCAQDCSTDAECGSGKMCHDQKCVQKDTYCSDQTKSVSPGALGTDGNYTRSYQDCGSYRCEPVSGQCRTRCRVSDDCGAGLNCYVETGRCG